MDKDNYFSIPEGVVSPAEVLAAVNEPVRPTAKALPKLNKAISCFPLTTLPPKLAELITGSITALGMPADFTAASCLVAAGIAAGNTCHLEIKQAVTQSPIFYLVLVGNPNCNKSGALKFALKPIIERDNEDYADYRRLQPKYEAIRQMDKAERKEAGISELPAPPVYSRTLVTDTTPEALVSIHQDNLKGIAVHRDELAGWVKDFNRYHPGSELEMWLTNWNGDTLTVDRKNAGTIRIPQSCISVVGTIQPGVIEELAAGTRGVNGFMDRLIFVWPDNLEKPEWTETEINLPLLNAYQNAINRLLDLGFDDENQTLVLKLSPEAKTRLFNFYNIKNKPLCDDAPSEVLAGIHGKFDIHAARIIIALHLLWWAYSESDTPPSEVQFSIVEKAIEVAEFFRVNALKVYSRLHNDTPVDRLSKDRKAVYEALPTSFKKSEGMAIAKTKKMEERTFSRFLNDPKANVFVQLKHGHYEKIY